ncbi:MAG TPA: FAD-dependent oxidoreductase [Patescibacteria group bacterium]|nr:FAD-dependent oxidoreductase [Patescibacteria group bacterium]
MVNRKRIVILGAGLAGLSAAWHLQRKGIDCLVFEKAPDVGGLCRSKKIGGFVFDYDGHLLHFRHRYTFELVKDFLADNLSEHRRNSWIYSSGRYTRYPFQANLYGLPSSIVKECLMGFIETAREQQEQGRVTFFDWIHKKFGNGISRHFMVPYNTKFWTIPPEEMTCEWLDGFVPVPSLHQVIEGTIQENRKSFGYNAHFWYPKKGGINELVSALASRIKNIYTNCQVTGIDTRNKCVHLDSGSKERYDLLISSIPLPDIPHMVSGMPKAVAGFFKRLRWNSVFNLNIGVDKQDYLGRHWVYFPEKELSFFRVGCFHNFSSTSAPPGKSSLYIEVAYSKEKPIDKTKIIFHIKEDLKKVGILAQGDGIVSEDINDIKYAYPIYDRHWQQNRNEIVKYLGHHDILPVGRYGSWRYMSMEDVILDGKAVAEKIGEEV